MPPVQHMETLAVLGICAGTAVFLILLMLLGVVALLEKVLPRTRRQEGDDTADEPNDRLLDLQHSAHCGHIGHGSGSGGARHDNR